MISLPFIMARVPSLRSIGWKYGYRSFDFTCMYRDSGEKKRCVFSKRVLPGDVKILYLGESAGKLKVKENPFRSELDDRHFRVKANEKKGGLHLTEWLTFGCLAARDNEKEEYCLEWVCPICGLEMYSGPLERLSHYAECLTEQKETDKKEREREKKSADPNAREYDCPKCGVLMLTATEILKHKRACRLA